MSRDDRIPRGVGGFFAAPREFSYPIGADPMGQNHGALGAMAGRGNTPAGLLRAATLFIGDMGGILMAATVAFLLLAAVAPPPVLRAVEKADQYGLHWTGWSTLLALALLVAYFAVRGHYTGRVPFWLELKQLVVGTVFALLLDAAIRVSVFGAPCGFETVARWVLMIPGILLTRQTAQVILRQAGLWDMRTLVIDAREGQSDADPAVPDPRGFGPRDAKAALGAELGSGYGVVATASVAEAAGWSEHSLAAMIAQCGCEIVVLVVGAQDAEGVRAERTVISALDRAGAHYAIVPAIHHYVVPMTGYSSRHSFKPGAVMMVRDHLVRRRLRRVAKSAFDRIVAALLLVVVSPVFLFLLWRVRADGGPALFGHERIGADGIPFQCLKFRTMVPNAREVLHRLLREDEHAAAEWAARRKLTHDPRITRLGRLLRTSSLDELPQLVNVLRGEMSLVGPRPIVEEEIQYYGHDFMYYCGTKPGITGLWQISGRSGTTYEERVKCDVWYVQNWTLWHDGAILLKTISAVLQRRGAV